MAVSACLPWHPNSYAKIGKTLSEKKIGVPIKSRLEASVVDNQPYLQTMCACSPDTL